MAVASLSGLTVRYGSKVAVSGLSVDFPEGCVGLLGPNGAGKSTLIKTLLGFLKPAAGNGDLLGLNILTQRHKIRQKVGLMPETDCHIPGMNAVSFVAFTGELSGMPSAQAISRAHETLDYCGLGEARYRKVETYSTGMKQRIKLAQALVHGPKLLFLDEPTNGLDPDGREEMLQLIRRVTSDLGVNVVVSSHLLPDIEKTCEHLVVMRRGQVVMQGETAKLRATQGIQMNAELRLPSDAFVEWMETQGAKTLLVHGSNYRFSIPETVQDPVRMLFEAAFATKVQLRGATPAERSLEDVFLEAVE